MSAAQQQCPLAYTCAACGEEFHSERSEGEADAEAEKLFGVTNASTRPDYVVVCDDCFLQLVPGGHTQ